METLADLLIASFAVWRLSSFLAREDGPWDIFAKLRSAVGVRFYGEEAHGTNMVAKGILCPWCSSMWFAALVAIPMASSIYQWAILALATSTVSVLLEVIISEKLGD